MITQPKLTTDILFDLVKYYFKSQAPAVDKEMKEILGLALGSSYKTCRAVTSLLVILHQDSGVEQSSLDKFMSLCHGQNLPSLVTNASAADQDLFT